MVFQGFCRVAFVQKFWRHLLTHDHCLLHSMTSSRWIKETAMASFQLEECVQLAIAPTYNTLG